ncbi:hemolysin-III related-domain-containing protein [Mycena albidolilacea]|uniref:Hemolysin-III related-domain-containing protein n=1 Tax=Mycena albidolilacea TaxID=1033008 RepID=A0AAD7A0J5_9AGAR|nr:hemolysin-III related-domain-containing protein [Mycena albidolilacea]
MSAPPPRAAPPRLPPCRPLPPSLEALDLSPTSPAQALSSLRFLVLSYLADLERLIESADWASASTALDMLHAIRADVRSHLPDLPDLSLPDLHLPDVKSLVASIDFSRPLSYVPTLSARLRSLHAELAAEFLSISRPSFDFEFRRPSFDFDFRRPSFDFDFEFTRPSFDLSAPPVLRDILDAFSADVDAFLAELPSLSELPSAFDAFLADFPASLSRTNSSPSPADEFPSEEAALARADYGSRLVNYSDLPLDWRNNQWVVTGYRFIPLSRWPRLLLSVFQLHNETLNIHTHFLPLLIWGAAFYGLELPFPSSLSSFLPSPLASASSSWSRYTPFAPPRAGPLPADEALFTLFALACLACSSLWHTMAGCAHKRGMETCARIDYVGIGWLIAMSIATVVHHGYACAERLSTLAAWPAYHPVGAACLVLCAAAGVSGNVLPFCDWFNRVENRLWRLAFFVGISFSAIAPMGGIAVLSGWGVMWRFIAPIGPSLLYYVLGLVVYALQVPERFLGGGTKGAQGKGWRAWVGRVCDMCGGGSHAIWHVFIVLAMRAHRDGIREMRRAAETGGCAIGV